MADSDAISRNEFREAHDAVKADIARLDKQLNGNGQPGAIALITDIASWVKKQEGKEIGEEKAKQDALILAAGNERKNARSRSLARWVATVVFTVFFGVTGWGLVRLWNWLEPPIALIVREYYQHHPDAAPRGYAPPQPKIAEPKTTGQTYNAHNNAPQDAANNPHYQ